MPPVMGVSDKELRVWDTGMGLSATTWSADTRHPVYADHLGNVGLTVEEVSKRLGYIDTSTFCHAFKRWYGVPPSGYLDKT